jgi:succinate dehydrogenase/fumarate reductase cytochrome b subunit
VSVKGDARSEAPSSEAARVPQLQRLLSGCDRYAGLGFAGFILLHCACEAFRAHSDGALPEAGFELTPALVVSVLLLVWLPFALFAWGEVRRGLPDRTAVSDKARALAVLERITLALVLVFTALHVAQVVWPLLSRALTPGDVRLELVAQLSGTQHGVPFLAAGYLCGVGAAAFLGTRRGLWALGEPGSRTLSRATVALGVLAYVLGSYAVIRCASGVILP